MRYRLRTLLMVLTLAPPAIGFLTPPLAAWLRQPQSPPVTDIFASSTLEIHEGPASWVAP